MGEQLSSMDLIQSNLTQLTQSTVIRTEFVTLLFERKLIDDEEKDLLLDERTPSSRKAMELYTQTARKWTEHEFEAFKFILIKTGNSTAIEILTSAPLGSGSMGKANENIPTATNKEMELLSQQKNKNPFGSYEGVSLEEEIIANKIVEYAKGGSNVCKTDTLSFLENFKASLKNECIWWNPHKSKLPSNYIQRKVCQTRKFYSDGSVPTTAETMPLLEVNGNLVVLVDSPGMGKSTEVTDLEQKLREKITTNRIIVRVKLNEVQKQLSTISNESSFTVLVKLVPFLPIKTLKTVGIRVFVLLDGLDEVCPRHQATMVNLLRILTMSREIRDLRVILTTRIQLREVIESTFSVDSWSLTPLAVEEQNNYIQAKLLLTNEDVNDLRNNFPQSLKGLLTNPLMLFMVVDILKSSGSTSLITAVNVYDLYLRFVEEKHKLQLVEKEKMRPEDNFTEMRIESMLISKLPFCYHIAWKELLKGNPHDVQINQITSKFVESIGVVATEPPLSGSVVTEILSYGLLIQSSDNKLRFKHRSFAEFFYARLLLQPKTPQEVRDNLLGFIYGGPAVLKNVEKFVAAAVENRALQISLQITTDCLLISKFNDLRCNLLLEFVRGELFSHLVRDVLMAFVNGKPTDLFAAFRVLVDRSSREAFTSLFEWMSENREWSREQLCNISERHKNTSFSPPVARLLVAIGMSFEGQILFSEDELEVAFKSCTNLLRTIASIKTEQKNKWEVVESYFGGGCCVFRKLIKKASDRDFFYIFRDIQSTWNLLATFSNDEVQSLICKENTRVTDVVGAFPFIVLVAVGEEFIPPNGQLAEFRTKFRDSKRNTCFELFKSGFRSEFPLDYFWGNLVEEAQEKNSTGPVTLALREAIGSRSCWEVLNKLEGQIRLRRKCPHDCDEAIRIMDWVLDGGRLWDTVDLFPLEMLPFVIRYLGTTNHVRKIVQQNEHTLGNEESTLKVLLKSLILSTHHPNSSTCFPQVLSLVKKFIGTLTSVHTSIAQVLKGAKKGELQASFTNHPFLLVSDVSVGHTLIKLIRDPKSVEFSTFVELVIDVIEFTPCCELNAALQQLKKLPEKKLREVLLSGDVIFQWQERFESWERKKENYICGLRGLISFYFEIFGLNLDWMGENGKQVEAIRRHFVEGIPVEIVWTLESNPLWTHLVPQFEEMMCGFQSLNDVIRLFDYSSEAEWERLLRMTGDQAFQSGVSSGRDISSSKAAAFIRVFIKKFGVSVAKNKIRRLWEQIPPNANFKGDSVESKASLLHCAIELGELEEVESRAFPGLLFWRNSEGKNALELAQENLSKSHPISFYLKQQTLLMD